MLSLEDAFDRRSQQAAGRRMTNVNQLRSNARPMTERRLIFKRSKTRDFDSTGMLRPRRNDLDGNDNVQG